MTHNPKNESRAYPEVTITPKAESGLRRGHPWVFSDEITAISGGYENGELVDVRSAKGRYLGTGFINDHSKIRVRIISSNMNDAFDEAFFERRLRYALEYRRAVMGEDFSCCRLVFGEADGLPGLTIDRYGDVLVLQSLCLGTDRRKRQLVATLIRLLCDYGERIEAVFERSDVKTRKNEGLEPCKGFIELPGLITRLPELSTRLPELSTGLTGRVNIIENDLEFIVDYVNGQKTGYFLDQKDNRALVAKLARGQRVLDCFTHTGTFALCAAKGGAESVVGIDVSEDALSMARENARRNALQERITFHQADVFDLLTQMLDDNVSASPRREAWMRRNYFDYIILDPPAFTKSRSTIKNAMRGYKQLNFMAMKLLPRGGYLATCSCSHFLTDELFRQVLREAASEAERTLKEVARGRQSADHPILWNVPETDYLKFYIFQVV